MGVVLLLLAVLVGVVSCTEPEIGSKRHGLPVQVATDTFVVELALNADADAVAAQHGFQNLGQVGTLKGMYRFKEVLSKRRMPPMSDNGEVKFHQRLVKRKRFVRDFETPLSDPLWDRQWDLHDNPLALNVRSVWALNITGVGVNVAVVDDGLETLHNDIFGNYNAIGSTDINFRKSDPTPFSYDSHGTSAAGCASAIANNGVCGAGTAPRSKVSGIRLIAANTDDADEAEGLHFGVLNNQNHIFTSSWGPYDDAQRLEGPGNATQRAFEDGVKRGRNGKGAIYVWACGNGRASNDNCNYDGYANHRLTIPVGAINAGGIPAWYSEPCAALYCVVPSSGGNNGGIPTIDLRGRCTSSFGGTSAASPLMAGVIALMLEMNSNLTTRDVQHVIANAATKNGLRGSGWTRNAAGFNHNHDFGFGRIDALTAVQKAKEWVNVPPEQIYESGRINVNQAIAGASSAPLIGSFNVTGCNVTYMEQVDLIFSATHPSRGQLYIALVSPSGTRSVLQERHADSNANFPFDGWRFGTVRNWGEDANGEWKVEVSNQVSQTPTGRFLWFNLQIYGYKR